MDRNIKDIIGRIICIAIAMFNLYIIIKYAKYSDRELFDDRPYKDKLDTIKHKILEKESKIIDIKKTLIYELEQANNCNDSNTIILFKELASSK